MWQNTGVFNGSQSVNGNYTTPTGVNSFQVGTAVTLDKGYLEFSGVTLTTYNAALPSAALSITAGDAYQFNRAGGRGAGCAFGTRGADRRIWTTPTNSYRRYAWRRLTPRSITASVRRK